MRMKKAGCGSLNVKQSERICEEMTRVFKPSERDDAFHTFATGFVAGLAFVACPEESDMYVAEATDVVANSFAHLESDKAMMEASRRIIDLLEELGGR